MIALLLCCCALAAPCASPALAYGEQPGAPLYPSDVPLVVIRFNQPRVMYQNQLYNAIAKAVQIKPTVFFTVVSLVPSVEDSYQSERLTAHASTQTSGVLSTLRSMGIPRDRIRVSREQTPGLRAHEVHIYVE
jgi:hypothetical protein